MIDFKEKLDILKEEHLTKKILERDILRFSLLVLIVVMFSLALKVDRYIFVDKGMIFGYELSRSVENENSWLFAQKEDMKLSRLYEDEKMKEIVSIFPEIDLDFERKLGGIIDTKDGYLNSFGESKDDFYEILLPYSYDENIVISMNDTTLLMQPLGYDENSLNPIVIGNKLLYKDIFKSVSIVRKFVKDGFKEYVYVENGESNKIFNYKLNVSGDGYVSLENNQIVVYDEEGIERFVLPQVIVKDVNGNNISGVHLSLLGDQVMEIRIDDDKSLNYPLLIDAN